MSPGLNLEVELWIRLENFSNKDLLLSRIENLHYLVDHTHKKLYKKKFEKKLEELFGSNFL